MTTYYIIRDSDGRKSYHCCHTQGLADLAPDEEFHCMAPDDEVATVAAFFGYTVPQFTAQIAKVQAVMIRDHRRQTGAESATEFAYHRRQPSRAKTFAPGHQGPTIAQALLATFILLAVVVAVIFIFR